MKPFEFQTQLKSATPNQGMHSPTVLKIKETTPLLQTPEPESVEPGDHEESQPAPQLNISPAPDKSETPRYGKTIKDRVILQRWRARDLADTGRTEIADQGIFIDSDGKAYIVKGGIADTRGSKPSSSGNRTTSAQNTSQVNTLMVKPRPNLPLGNTNSSNHPTGNVGLLPNGGPSAAGPPGGGPPPGGPLNGGSSGPP